MTIVCCCCCFVFCCCFLGGTKIDAVLIDSYIKDAFMQII